MLAAQSPSSDGFRVLTAELQHETNTFSVIPTTIENFRQQYYITSSEEIEQQRRGTKSVLGATYEAADKYKWKLTNTISAAANPTGKVTAETFESLCEAITGPIMEENCFDGILLHLHGAMVSEKYEDADGEIIARCRLKVGPTVPIFVTLDLHCNMTLKMAENCNCFIAVRTYPHIDYYEVACWASDLLQKSMTGEIELKTVMAKRPILLGLDGGKTHEGSPIKTLINRSEVIEKDFEFNPTSMTTTTTTTAEATTTTSTNGKNGVVAVISVCAGFTGADVLDVGPSVTVAVNVKKQGSSSSSSSSAADSTATAVEQGRAVAESFMDYAWETRRYVSATYLSIAEAVSIALAYNPYDASTWTESGLKDTSDASNKSVHQLQPPAPLVLADVSDNPGSGHYGDATALLQEMIERKVQNALFYALYDPEAVKQAVAVGVGNIGTVTMGGRWDPTIGGGPLTVTGKVVSVTDGSFPCYGPILGGVWQHMGLSVLFRVNDAIDVVLISQNGQVLDIAQITSLGVDPVRKSVIAVKSKHHFRASLAPLAGRIITVNGGGLGSAIIEGGNYKNVRRPIFPLDDI